MQKINEKILIIIFFCIIISPLTLTVLGDWAQKNFDVDLEDNSGVLHTYPNFNLENFGLSNTKNKREKHRAYNRCIADTSRLYALCFSLLTPEGVHAVKPQSISGGSGRGCRAFHPISPANL